MFDKPVLRDQSLLRGRSSASVMVVYVSKKRNIFTASNSWLYCFLVFLIAITANKSIVCRCIMSPTSRFSRSSPSCRRCWARSRMRSSLQRFSKARHFACSSYFAILMSHMDSPKRTRPSFTWKTISLLGRHFRRSVFSPSSSLPLPS